MKTVYTLPKSRILILLFLLTLTALSGAFSASAQTDQVGDYRSNAVTMNWTTAASWQVCTVAGSPGTWTTASSYPGQNANVGTVTIRTGNTVTLNTSLTTYRITTLTVTGTNSTTFGKLLVGNDYTFNVGTVNLTNYGQLAWGGNYTLTLTVNASLVISSGGNLFTGNPCNNNVRLNIGTVSFAACKGGGNVDFTFAQLNAGFGTITAVPSASPTTICSGSSTSLSGTYIGTTGGNTVTYSWTGTGPTGYTFTPVTTQNPGSQTLTIPGTYTYSLTAQFTISGAVYSNTQSVTVTVLPTTAITTQPSTAAQTICQNTPFSSISVTAVGDNLTYQWYSNTSNSTSGGTLITGAINNTYTPLSTTPGTHYYYCVVSGTCGTATSNVSGAFIVNPLPQGSLSGNTICPGGTGQLTFTATEGTGPFTVKYTYISTEYTQNDVYSGTAFNATPNPATLGTYTYTLVSVTDANGCIRTNGFTQGTATITVSNTATTWTGNTNTNWNEVGNWSCGKPTTTSNVTIPTGLTNYPVVEIPNAVCNDLTIENGATLTIKPGMLLTVGGKITGAEDATKAGKIRVKAATDGTTPNGSLIINCTANTSNPVFGTVEFYTKGNKATTAVTWYDNIDGSPTKGTTFNANYQWQFFGVPVKEVVANPTFYGSFLRKYREDLNSTTTAKWEVLNNASVLKAFEGYEITQAAAKRIDIVGELQFCDKTLTLTRLAPVATDNIRFGLGQNIFGNSYTAAIKISEMTIPATVDQTVYLYNTGSLADWAAANLDESPFNSPMTAGSYISIPKQVSNTIWDDQIPSMQGFLLKYTNEETNYNADASQNAQVILKYDGGGVAGNTRPQLAPKAEEEPLSYLRVNLQSKTTTDNLWLFSREGTSSSFDNGWDGHKHFGTPTAFIYSMTPDGPMQVNTDKTIDGSVINFYANEDTEYTLTLVKSNLDQYSDLKLIDFGTKTVTPLTAEMTRYNFSSSNAGVVEKRFMIVNSASKIDFKKNDFSLLYGYLNADKTLIVTNFSGEPGTMTLSTSSGVTVMNKPLTTGTSHFPTSLKAGAYVLTMQAGANQTSMKVLVNNK